MRWRCDAAAAVAGPLGGPASPNGTPWSQPEFVDLCGRTAQSDDWTLDSLLDGVNAVSGGEPFGDDCTLVRLSFP